MHEFLNIAPEVAQALDEQRPVVALESTVIAHGLPRPQNLETARRLEAAVREGGAVPTTIAIIGGKLKVGLSDDEIQLLAEQRDIRKISTRDISIAVAQGWNGATTVAATTWIAHRVGLKVFATGGIGGVHRGSLPDVSADLPELARTPIAVVCSGGKIVLDLPATREWLETHAITIVGYDNTDDTYTYLDTCGRECGSTSNGGTHDIAQKKLFKAMQMVGRLGDDGQTILRADGTPKYPNGGYIW